MDKMIAWMQNLEDSVDQLKKENKTLKKVLTESLAERDEKISQLESHVLDLNTELLEQQEQIQVINDKCKKADKLQVLLNGLVLKIGRERSLRDELLRLKSKVGILNGWTADLEARHEVTLLEVESLKDKMSSVENILQDTKQQVAENENIISSLKTCKDAMVKTAFHVNLKRRKELTTGFLSRLDHCDRVDENSQSFDQQTALFTAPTAGLYMFYVTVFQENTGSLTVAVGPEDGRKYCIACPYVSSDWTDTTRDNRSGSIVLHLAKGQKVGVSVLRTSGEAKEEQCRFGGCLLSASI